MNHIIFALLTLVPAALLAFTIPVDIRNQRTINRLEREAAKRASLAQYPSSRGGDAK